MRAPHLALGLCLIVVGWTETARALELTPAAVWMTDFAGAQAEARRLHRPMVVHFHTRTCPPCRQMERDILHTPHVLKLLDDGFVAVKVDLDPKAGNGNLQTLYSVVDMPTDLVIGHDGKVMHRSRGYDARTADDRQKYLAALARIDLSYATEGKRLPRTGAPEEQATVIARDTIPQKPAIHVDQSDKSFGKLVPEPVEPYRVDVSVKMPAADAVPLFPEKSASFVVALDGYCPVTLRTTRTWKKGDRQLTLDHDGQTFVFVAADKRDEFKANPSRYAPRMLGCDPVVFSESRMAIRGSTKFGAYYEGELFLFETAETRARFRKDPSRYRNLQHALKPADVQDPRKQTTTAAK